jgi:thiol:disulfide interchange protein DsbD
MRQGQKSLAIKGALLASFLILGIPVTAQSQDSRGFDEIVTNILAKVVPETVLPGQTATLKIIMDIAPGWHTYPTFQLADLAKSSINVFKFPAPSKEIVFVGALKEPPFLVSSAPDTRGVRHIEGSAEWERPFVIRPNATPGSKTVALSVKVLVCNDQGHCLAPHDVPLKAQFNVKAGPAVAVEDKYKAEIEKTVNGASDPPYDPFNQDKAKSTEKPAAPEASPTETPPEKQFPKSNKPVAAAGPKVGTLSYPTTEAYGKEMDTLASRVVSEAPGESSVTAFVLAGIFWGAVSLITPCVFPMIPITVSFFLKQSEKQRNSPLLMATVYCLTIIVVLTLAALLLLSFFRSLSINPYMNFAMGALFIFFALSLFGMYEIELPSSLAQFTSAREGQGGLLGTMFMALTFTILSFACVAPFLGGFGGTAATAKLSWFERGLGALAFAVTFASPFFFLALFPSLLKKMPKSGTWLNSVKVVMGFLELAAAFKFLRLGEIVIHTPTLFTFDFVLGIWVAICFLCGFYLLNLFRLPHDTPVEHLGVPRLLFSILFLGVGLYLLPALFRYNAEGEKQRPSGIVYAWLDSFLLPDPTHGKGSLEWTGDLKLAVDEALEERKKTGQPQFVFIDITGETCVNCKLNERNVFSKSEFKDLFKKYKLVQLYTDLIPEAFYAPEVKDAIAKDEDRRENDAKAVNLKFQKDVFDTEQLPLYVILEPLPNGKIKVVGRWDEGKINDEAGFASFLKEPLSPLPGGMRAELSAPR